MRIECDAYHFFLTNKNFNQAIALAKQQNKLLFVEAYAPDCHVCQSFKGTFAQPQVGALYNAKFINYQLDLRQQMNYQILRQLKNQGMSILLVEHDMDLVMDVCDHLVVMEFGTLLTQGTPSEIQASPAVRAAYLGLEH